LSGLFDLFVWTQQDDIPLLADVVLGALILGWFSACYASSMLMMKTRTSASGFGKFLATWVMMTTPSLLAAALIILAFEWSNTPAYVAGGLMIIAGFVVLVLLPGWPIVQALSPSLIRPLQALRATRGYRWGLTLTAFLSSTLNRLVPTTSSTTDFATACVLAGAGIVVSVASGMAIVSISVAAARLMDSKLRSAKLT